MMPYPRFLLLVMKITSNPEKIRLILSKVLLHP